MRFEGLLGGRDSQVEGDVFHVVELLMGSEANHMHEKRSSLMHDFRPRLYSVSRGPFCEEDFHAPLFAETISEANRGGSLAMSVAVRFDAYCDVGESGYDTA